jgi:hypothetical protein
MNNEGQYRVVEEEYDPNRRINPVFDSSNPVGLKGSGILSVGCYQTTNRVFYRLKLEWLTGAPRGSTVSAFATELGRPETTMLSMTAN